MQTTKSDNANSETATLITGISASRFNINSSGLQIIYKETGKPYEGDRTMSFGIEFSPSGYSFRSDKPTNSPGYVVTLVNRRDVDEHSGHRYTEAEVIVQKEAGSTGYADSLERLVKFELDAGLTDVRYVGSSIEKADEYFGKILNNEAKEKSVAQKLYALFCVADRMRTLYIHDLKVASAIDLALIPKKLELLDNIAHAAMAGMIKIRAADPVKPRT